MVFRSQPHSAPGRRRVVARGPAPLRAAAVAGFVAVGFCLDLPGLTATAAAQLTGAPASVPRVDLRPCTVASAATLCGRYVVPEAREGPRGRSLSLKIVVLPARRRDARLPPVFYLAGGPGEAASELVSLFVDAPEHADMDIVFVDQRGTADHHRLQCPAPQSGDFLRGPFDPARIEACRESLQGQADLSWYDTASWISDLEEVRAALGYDRISIISGSFGTYAAQEYMRRHGDRVRAAYMLGPVLPPMRVPLHMPADGQAALERVFARCAADRACRTAFPRPADQLRRVIARLRQGPVRTPAGDEGREIELTEEAFVDALRVFLYSSQRAAQIPYLLDRAAQGELREFADVALRAMQGIYTGLAAGLNLAVTCSEFANRISDRDLPAATEGSFLGAWRINAQRAACAVWPRTRAASAEPGPFASPVPALIISGEADPVSQPRWGAELRRSMPNAAQVVVPGAGHTEEPPCIVGMRAAFLRAGTAVGLDTSCLSNITAPRFRTR